MAPNAPGIERLTAAAYTMPTEAPEADGTLCWDSTTMVVVEASAAGCGGIGYSYCDASAAALIERRLAPLLQGMDAFAVPLMWRRMVEALRNVGWPGMGAMAVSAVDSALWDLKARILNLSLAELLGRERDEVPIYGSGGFTSYSLDELCSQGSARQAQLRHGDVRPFRQRPRSLPHQFRSRLGRGTQDLARLP